MKIPVGTSRVVLEWQPPPSREIARQDAVQILIDMSVPGWVFHDARESLRKQMHDRVDELIDSMVTN